MHVMITGLNCQTNANKYNTVQLDRRRENTIVPFALRAGPSSVAVTMAQKVMLEVIAFGIDTRYPDSVSCVTDNALL